MIMDYQLLLEARFKALFERYAEDKDVTPAQRFRLEGFVEAGLELGLITEPELLTLKQQCAEKAFGSTVSAEWWGDAIVIPAMMKRAPVKPSSK